MSNEKGLSTLGLSSLEKMRPRGNLTAFYSFQMKRIGERGDGLCSQGTERQDVWEQQKAAPGEVQTGHEEKFVYHEGEQTVKQTS